jgi:ubiquinone/menaquinone biosynthesis C-methylase UbiE
MKLIEKYLETWHKLSISNRFQYKRVQAIDKICNNQILQKNSFPIKIIEIGCGEGKDFIKFLSNRNDLKLVGLDVKDHKIKQDNFQMIVEDAEHISFPDKYFDYAISIGVLEHITPIEKLCSAIREIDRVSKSYCVVVPSINTLLEPHTGSFKWQLKDHNKKEMVSFGLNYISDDGWLEFSGFKNAQTLRYDYIPMLINDLIIFKNEA